ncbi:HDOD domain-containing protein [Clostridium beijerinckii]|uniref:Stage 0 sporulation protein A homolog n=1 Tax=Clostridium beijerinckii TaxID=1520 RepID=A0AAW3WE23_CLOBE|nr:HDOD domain-containing protein [Clostridium beijerinckii]MBC2459162.1 HDOD domain-containing protein [Clostridium beijerinckii]MBC2476648.1 HDOD domain-containing protein [Clostridium beijerinckii]NOV61119.1 HD-like signal output (HDOD) protein [Clostridium beijerinckii]NOV69388.1 HD-like signal output (HDOD) protein [Clostridium beijerinckii]NOW33016.1 HD-like signal output (HDOD) protein [Clostridium beijerinckii]
MGKKILFVDDEVQILKAFKRLFMDTDYEIDVAESGLEALNILENQEVDLIVSDMKMPNMTGYELLSIVKNRFPDIVRIILSGFAEERIILDSLQKNIAKVYILKPWENNIFIETIDNIFKVEDMLKENINVLKLVKSANELPTIKESYQKIIDEIESNAEIYEIVEAIESDNSIAIKILHVINSSHYGVKTGSIKRAVAYLGLDNIKNIVISSAFIDSLGFDSKGKEKLKMLWKQSFIANRIVSFIYNEFLNKKIPETEMNAGLLSNIGMAFMMYHFQDKYSEIIDEVKNHHTAIVELEKKCFGTNHQEIGGYLLRWWDIPFPIVEAAIYHHEPFHENVINKQIVYVVHIAGKYAWDILKESSLMDLDEKAFLELGIDKDIFEKRLGEVAELNGLFDE